MLHKFSRETPLYVGASILLLLLLIFSFLYALTLGSVEISTYDVYYIIASKLRGINEIPDIAKSTVDIVWHVRLPRLILGIGVGSGLAVCGVVMQAIVKNPLAEPFILGISSGASLGATMAIMLGVGASFGPNAVGVSAFAMAFLVSILVITIANSKGRANSAKLLLTGMAISTMCSAFSNFIIFTSSNTDGIKTVTFWLMGSLSGATWENIQVLIPVVALSMIFFITQYRTLNLMLLGDEVSITLGKDLHIYRNVYLLVTALVIGFVVYNSGVIGFVGFLIPHVARIFFGTDHKKIIFISALLGSILIIWADVASRVIIPGSELPIGIMISMIGAPAFIYFMVNKSYGFGGGK